MSLQKLLKFPYMSIKNRWDPPKTIPLTRLCH